MKTVDYIGLISSILGIVGALWGVVVLVFKPYFKKKEELGFITELIEDEYKRWKDIGYIERGDTHSIDGQFKRVDKYRKDLKSLPVEKLLYLFRCSLQNGMKGNWGKWLRLLPFSEDLILLLIEGIDGKTNLRPTWRRAFILQTIFKGKESLLRRVIPKTPGSDELIQIIIANRLEEYLADLSKEKSSNELKPKAIAVLQEIKHFKNDVQLYAENISSRDFDMMMNAISKIV